MFFMNTVLSEVSPYVTIKRIRFSVEVYVGCSSFFPHRLPPSNHPLLFFHAFLHGLSPSPPSSFLPEVCKSFRRLAYSLDSRLHLFHAPYFRRWHLPTEHSIQYSGACFLFPTSKLVFALLGNDLLHIKATDKKHTGCVPTSVLRVAFTSFTLWLFHREMFTLGGIMTQRCDCKGWSHVKHLAVLL